MKLLGVARNQARAEHEHTRGDHRCPGRTSGAETRQSESDRVTNGSQVSGVNHATQRVERRLGNGFRKGRVGVHREVDLFNGVLVLTSHR